MPGLNLAVFLVNVALSVSMDMKPGYHMLGAAGFG